jgi:hypothetical protein
VHRSSYCLTGEGEVGGRLRYDGAAVLPQTFNEHYFQTTVMQVPSRDGARYLYVPLSFPSGAQAGFQQEFSDLMRSAWDGP